MNDRPIVLLSEEIHPDAMARLDAEAEIHVASGFDEESLAACVGQAHAIILRRGRATRRVIEAAPRLRVIARHGAGFDTVDVDAARERGVIVTNTPDAVTVSVAEHTVALLLSVSRRIAVADRGLRAGDWEVRARCWGVDLCGRTLGVVGFGRIGQRVARICGIGLGMDIVYQDVRPVTASHDLGARRLTLDEVLTCADVVSLHTPLSASTRHLIGRRELGLLKATAILINTSRGPVVDELALAEALREGRLAGAGLDVFEKEPIRGVHPLCEFENVVVTPHIGSQTPQTRRRMAMDAAEEVLGVLAGRPPLNPVM